MPLEFQDILKACIPADASPRDVLRMFRLELRGRGPADVCAEAGGVGAWLRRTADKKSGCFGKHGYFEGGIEIGIGIEIEKFTQRPDTWKVRREARQPTTRNLPPSTRNKKQETRNLKPETLHPSTFNQKRDTRNRDHMPLDFEPDADFDFDFDNSQPSTRNDKNVYTRRGFAPGLYTSHRWSYMICFKNAQVPPGLKVQSCVEGRPRRRLTFPRFRFPSTRLALAPGPGRLF